MTIIETAPDVAPLRGAPNYQVPVSAELLELAKHDAGAGVSTRAEDQQLPFLRVLQSTSPMCSKRDAAFVEGAQAGHFYLRGSLEPVRDGQAGLIVQVCAMLRAFVEFRPSRGGFVTSHSEPPADTVQHDLHEDGRVKSVLMRTGNRNIIQDTRQLYLLVGGSPFVLACTSTLHTFAKGLNGDMCNRLHSETHEVLPSFIHTYKLVTIPISNALGKWFGLKFTYIGPVSSPAEYDAGRRFHQIVMNGRARIETPSNSDT
jgi:hypothetical protein